MRAPLSWLRDFAPFPDDVGELRAALDDLGLVVEAVEHVGEGLGDVVVSRVLEIRPIKGADRIRLRRRGRRRRAARDRLRRAQLRGGGPGPPGSGRHHPARAASRSPGASCVASTSNGMLCSGRELGLSDDGAGLLILGDESPGEPGTPLMEALGLEPDIVFDITVEGNRPDAWSITGIARDLAGRLRLPFSAPEPPEPAPSGWPVESAATASVDVARPVPPPHRDGARPTSRSARRRAGSPERLLLAGMRPINNVVDASNYVMLELGQPTHPYDLSLLPGRGLTRPAGPAG